MSYVCILLNEITYALACTHTQTDFEARLQAELRRSAELADMKTKRNETTFWFLVDSPNCFSELISTQ